MGTVSNVLLVASDENSKIIFLNFNVIKGSPHTIVKLEKATKVIGKLKKVAPNEIHNPDFLTLEIYNNDALIQIIKVEHPLKKMLEYVDEDKKFKTKKIDSEKDNFTIRFQNKGDSGKIVIYETLANKEQTKINTIKF